MLCRGYDSSGRQLLRGEAEAGHGAGSRSVVWNCSGCHHPRGSPCSVRGGPGRRTSRSGQGRRGRGVRGQGGGRRSGGERGARTRPRAAPRLHRLLPRPGLRLHAAGGSDRKFSHAQHRRSRGCQSRLLEDHHHPGPRGPRCSGRRGSRRRRLHLADQRPADRVRGHHAAQGARRLRPGVLPDARRAGEEPHPQASARLRSGGAAARHGHLSRTQSEQQGGSLEHQRHRRGHALLRRHLPLRGHRPRPARGGRRRPQPRRRQRREGSEQGGGGRPGPGLPDPAAAVGRPPSLEPPGSTDSFSFLRESLRRLQDSWKREFVQRLGVRTWICAKRKLLDELKVLGCLLSLRGAG